MLEKLLLSLILSKFDRLGFFWYNYTVIGDTTNNMKKTSKFDKMDDLWYSSIVRVIRGYGKMKGYVLEYVCENEFKKLERALKKYNMLAFKKLNFDYYPALRNGNFVGELISVNKKNGTETYELKLPSDKMFAQIHGDVKLVYTVHKKDETIVLETITPSEILLEGHRSELTTYKGIMISKANASKDMFKIDLLNMLQDK